MTSRGKRWGVIVAAVLFVIAIVATLMGHGMIGIVLFIVAGVLAGVYGPPTDSSGIHGASDAN